MLGDGDIICLSIEEMDDILPHEGCRTLMERLWVIEGGLKEAVRGAQPMMEFCVQDIGRRLGTLMRLRYGSDPEIDRFSRATEEQRVGFQRQVDE